MLLQVRPQLTSQGSDLDGFPELSWVKSRGVGAYLSTSLAHHRMLASLVDMRKTLARQFPFDGGFSQGSPAVGLWQPNISDNWRIKECRWPQGGPGLGIEVFATSRLTPLESNMVCSLPLRKAFQNSAWAQFFDKFTKDRWLEKLQPLSHSWLWGANVHTSPLLLPFVSSGLYD